MLSLSPWQFLGTLLGFAGSLAGAISRIRKFGEGKRNGLRWEQAIVEDFRDGPHWGLISGSA
jgi:hypothetical protein